MVFSKRHAIGVDGAAMRIGRGSRRIRNVLLTRDDKRAQSWCGDSVGARARASWTNFAHAKDGHVGRRE